MATLDHTKYGYLTFAELEAYANITITDDAEALDNIQQAEEIIDTYVGYQSRFAVGPQSNNFIGQVSSVSGKTIYDTNSTTQLLQLTNYFERCWVEIIAGTGVGQVRRVVSSAYPDRSFTYEGDTFSPQVDTTSIFRIYQQAKFPRVKDVYLHSADQRYYKAIPEAIKRAVAAQVEYGINMGPDYFSTDEADKNSESIGNYSYSKGGGGDTSSLIKMVAPKARVLLRGIINRGGRIVAENPTWR